MRIFLKILPYLLMAMVLLFWPRLMPLAAQVGMTPKQIAHRITYGKPTPTAIPRIRINEPNISTSSLSSPAATATVMPSATPDAQAIRYSPPPKVSGKRKDAIGASGAMRGAGYSRNLRLRVGSFSAERGKAYAFWESRYFGRVTRVLQEEYPEVEAYIFDELDDESLNQIDLFITSATVSTGGADHGLFLSEEEKRSLREFVEEGGWLLLMLDPGFNTLTFTEALIEMAGLFDVTLSDDMPAGTEQHPIENGHLHRVTSGPWGEVSLLNIKQPVSFSDLGPYAESLLINNAGYPMLAVIDPGRIQPGSGAVLLVGDLELIYNMHDYADLSYHNDVLFHNYIDLALQAKAYKLGFEDVLSPEATPAVTPPPPTPRPVMPPYRTGPKRVYVGGALSGLHRGVKYMRDTPLRIGSFTGIYLDVENPMRAILKEYPEASHTTFERLTSENVSTTDMLILISKRDPALDELEQRVLLDYALHGGCTVLMLDRIAPGSETQMLNMVAPFGVELTIPPRKEQGMDLMLPYEPTGKPLLDGPWGLVPNISIQPPVALTSAGPHGEVLMDNEYGGHLAFIEPDAIATGSGPVIMLASPLNLVGNRDYFNDILYFNIIEYCHLHTISRVTQ